MGGGVTPDLCFYRDPESETKEQTAAEKAVCGQRGISGRMDRTGSRGFCCSARSGRLRSEDVPFSSSLLVGLQRCTGRTRNINHAECLLSGGDKIKILHSI